MAWPANTRANTAIAAPSMAVPMASTASNGSGSPIIARAGHHSRLSGAGAIASSDSDCRTSRRDRVPVERIAATCSPMTKAAPITAATICATSRVRFGPMARNSATVSATASAVAAMPMAAMAP